MPAEGHFGGAYFGGVPLGTSGSPLTSTPAVPAPPQGAATNATVRLQALDGTWETCGANRAVKVSPETISYNHNEWGPDKASFDLHRSPIAIWSDIGAFTPVEIEIGGVIVWEGRTGETPLRAGPESVINVQCAGYQYQTDDDVYQRAYVHSKLTDWKDSRSFTECQLPTYRQSGGVQVQQGRVTLGYAKGAIVANGQGNGITLDLGPSTPGAEYVSVDLELVGNAEGFTFFIIGHDGFDQGTEVWANRVDAVSGAGLSSGNFQGGLSARRFISILFYHPGAEVTQAADVSIVLTGIRVFTSTSFESGGLSTLTADQVIRDALERATMLLSNDYSQIQQATFPIPDFVLSKLSTPKEAIEAANAYHNWVTKVLIGRRLAFRARPSAATLEIGAWSGGALENTSANNGAEIYSRVMVEASGPDGSPLVVERTASQQPGVQPRAISSPAPTNPSLATNTASWAATNGTISRDTSTFDTGPASLKVVIPGGVLTKITEQFTGTFKKGVAYKLAFAVRISESRYIAARFGFASDAGSATYLIASAFGIWNLHSIVWVPLQDRPVVTFTVERGPGPAGTLWLDSLSLAALTPTLVDRRGFRRTKTIQMSNATTPAEGQQIADIYLQGHMTTPFKGSAVAVPGSVRRVIGGQPMHPSQLGLHTQELLRLSHLIDPDTGGVGRDGTIAEVSYTHADQKAQVVLDDKRANFDALLSRLAVVQGVGS